MATFPDVRILGVDPGISGAVAIYCPGSIIKIPPRGVMALPTISREMTTKTKSGKPRYQRSLDVPKLLGWIQYHQPTHAFVEQVWAMPATADEETGEMRGMGNTSSFNFGRAYGEVLATVKCYGIDPVDVPPQSWQRTFELHKLPKGTDKGKASLRLAQQRHPSAMSFLKFEYNHNSAEALLIAEHGAIKLARVHVDEIEE